MMKMILLGKILIIFGGMSVGFAAPLEVGETSELVDFEIIAAGGVSNANLGDFEGKLVALMYYTPW